MLGSCATAASHNEDLVPVRSSQVCSPGRTAASRSAGQREAPAATWDKTLTHLQPTRAEFMGPVPAKFCSSHYNESPLPVAITNNAAARFQTILQPCPPG